LKLRRIYAAATYWTHYEMKQEKHKLMHRYMITIVLWNLTRNNIIETLSNRFARKRLYLENVYLWWCSWWHHTDP